MIVTAYGFSLSLRPNSITLDSAPEEPLALVWVALANNIGTGIPRSNQIPVNLPQDVGTVQAAIVRDGFGWTDFFDEHFQRISELTEVASIDLIAYLRVHPDKTVALDNYIAQLEEKREDALTATQSLTLLKDFHINAITGVQSDIKNAQAAVEQSYAQKNSDDIMNGIARLEELHIEEQEHRNIVIFSERFLAEYKTLISWTDKKLTVIKANTAALIQGITVSLPAGIDVNMLKDLKLFSTGTKNT